GDALPAAGPRHGVAAPALPARAERRGRREGAGAAAGLRGQGFDAGPGRGLVDVFTTGPGDGVAAAGGPGGAITRPCSLDFAPTGLASVERGLCTTSGLLDFSPPPGSPRWSAACAPGATRVHDSTSLHRHKLQIRLPAELVPHHLLETGARHGSLAEPAPAR